MKFRNISYFIRPDKTDYEFCISKTEYIGIPDTWTDEKLENYCQQQLLKFESEMMNELPILFKKPSSKQYLYGKTFEEDFTRHHGEYIYDNRTVLTLICHDTETRMDYWDTFDVDPDDDFAAIAKKEYDNFLETDEEYLTNPSLLTYEYYIETVPCREED